jgi:hypothetical protein
MPAALIAIPLRGRLVVGEIATYRFEQHINVAGQSKRIQESSEIERMGTEVMEHCTSVVKQGLDVNKLQCLFAIPHNPLTEVKTSLAFRRELARALEIISVGSAEDAGRFCRHG